MTSVVQLYKRAVRDTIDNGGLHVARDVRWEFIARGITQEILDDATQQSRVAVATFEPLVGPLIPRAPKTLKRVRTKLSEIEQHDSVYFRAVVDFIAFRVPCQVDQIAGKCNAIWNYCDDGEQKGSVAFKGTVWDLNRHQYVDIVQYCYAYLPSLGHIVEFQIGHPFASYTFAVDSALRDNPNCGLVDLWQGGVYQQVRSYILDSANNIPHPSGAKDEIWQALCSLHPNGELPHELSNIMNKFI